MPQPGDVLFYKDYEFEDKGKGDKLFVIIHDSPYLALKTTSKPARYPGVIDGCNPRRKVFYLPSSRNEGFPENTYIQLPQLIEFPLNELLQGAFKKQITIFKSISSACLQELKKCLQNFRDDISEEHWNILFSKTVTDDLLQKLAERFKKKS